MIDRHRRAAAYRDAARSRSRVATGGRLARCFAPPLTAVFVAALLVTGCGGSGGSVSPPPPQPSFRPAPGNLTVLALHPVTFQAFNPDGSAATATFWIGGTVAATDSEYVWTPDSLGVFTVRAQVEFDGLSYDGRWQVNVTDQGAKETPQVRVVDARPGPVPGSLVVEWNAPPLEFDNIPLKEYDIFWATTPISDADLPNVSSRTVSHSDEAIIQRTTIDGLMEKQLYHVRVRTRDALNREAPPSPDVSAVSTGHFDVTGVVERLIPQQPAAPLANVLVSVGDVKVFTAGDGRFAMLNLPDLLQARLGMQDDTGVTYYTVQTDTLPTIDQVWNVPLFPRDAVRIIDQSGESFWTWLRYFRAMTEKSSDYYPTTVHPWAHYPVQVYAEPYTFTDTSGVTVDYHAAFVWGVEKWNEMAGETLLELVDQPVDVGVNYHPFPEAPPTAFGEVTKLLPASGFIRRVQPILYQLRLKSTMNTQVFCNRIVTHELGHVLNLTHSPTADDLMSVGYPASTGGIPTRNEAFAARLLAHLPENFDLKWFHDPVQ